MNEDPNSWLMGGGTTAAKFPTIGTVVTGQIVDPPQLQQQRNFDTGKPETWDDGNPKMQLVVRIQTDQRDPDNPDDDGIRALYIKGQLQAAVRDAIRAAGAKGLEVGGTLAVKYDSDGTPTKRGLNPPKVYAARYTPPNPQDAFFGAPQPAAQAQPAMAGAPAPTTPDLGEPPF